MENRKLILSVYLVASALAWWLARSSFNFMYSFYEFRSLPGMQYGRETFPIAAALITFVVLLKVPRINSTLDEVVSELKKVTWPAYPDVVKATTVVLICITVASLLLAGFDLVFGRVIQWLMPA